MPSINKPPRTQPPITDANRNFPPISFNDDPNQPTPTPQDAFANYQAIGRQIMKWAMGDGSDWPESIEEMKAAFHAAGGDITIPDHLTNLKVIQADDDTFILRLPPKKQLMESDAQTRQHGTDNYPTPKLYEFLLTNERTVDGTDIVLQTGPILGQGTAQTISPGQEVPQSEVLPARVADYTMRGCR